MFPSYLKNVSSGFLFKSRPKQSPHIVFSCCVSSISGAQSAGEGGLSEHWILPLHCPAWPRPRPINSALTLTPSQASLLQPLPVWAMPRGILGPGSHSSQLLPSLNRQMGVQHPEGNLISIYFAGQPRCSRTPGNNRPKGSNRKWPGPTQTESRVISVQALRG